MDDRTHYILTIIMYDLIMVSFLIIFLAAAKLREILHDCKEREEKRRKIKEIRDGKRTSNTGTRPPC